MQTVGRSPDISVMWRTEYYAGAGYIRHVAVKRLMFYTTNSNKFTFTQLDNDYQLPSC